MMLRSTGWLLHGGCDERDVFEGYAEDIIAPDPGLGALGDHGGDTLTYPVTAGCPALGGEPGGCTDGDGSAIERDQRGFERTTPDCTIGAYSP